MLSFVAICPHPPIIIPSIGAGEAKKVKSTVSAMEQLARNLEKQNPDTIAIVSPHGKVEMEKMTIEASPKLSGDFLSFGDSIEMSFENDRELAEEIFNESENTGIPARKTQAGWLDHGTMVPLYFLVKKIKKIKIVPLAYSFLDYESHFEFGRAIYRAIAKHPAKIAFVASGDLSHRLTPDAPAGYSLSGARFDKLLIELLKKGDAQSILKLDPQLIEEAGECGFRSICVLLGVLESWSAEAKKSWQAEILSYEGPFGVGYLTANFKF